MTLQDLLEKSSDETSEMEIVLELTIDDGRGDSFLREVTIMKPENNSELQNNGFLTLRCYESLENNGLTIGDLESITKTFTSEQLAQEITLILENGQNESFSSRKLERYDDELNFYISFRPA